MARITHVKAAQQRYEMVRVLDNHGNPLTTPVICRSGEQKKTKRGREVVRRQTVLDKTKPLPNRVCEKCGQEIKVGQPYKWIAPKSGPYGGHKRYRCEKCPIWDVWDYSNSLSARTAEIAYNFSVDLEGCESEDDVSTALSAVAEGSREIAAEKREAAANIESGFGHSTVQSDELIDIADQLDNWADEVENVSVPSFDHAKEQVEDVEGNPRFACRCDEEFGNEDAVDEHIAEEMEAWREDVQGECGVVYECPV